MANVHVKTLLDLVKPADKLVMSRATMKKLHLIERKRALVQWGSQQRYKWVQKNPAILEAVTLVGTSDGRVSAHFYDHVNAVSVRVSTPITINISSSFVIRVYVEQLVDVLKSFKKNEIVDFTVTDDKLIIIQKTERTSNITRLKGLTENDVSVKIEE